MDLLDANVLIGAFRRDDPDHARLKSWLEDALSRGSTVSFPPLVEVAFLRIVTHPSIFRTPSPLEEAIGFLDGIQVSGPLPRSPMDPKDSRAVATMVSGPQPSWK